MTGDSGDRERFFGAARDASGVWLIDDCGAEHSRTELAEAKRNFDS